MKAIADVAATLAHADTLGDMMPGMLTTVAAELDGSQGSVWLRGVDGLRRAWTVGDDTTSAADVDSHLSAQNIIFAPGLVIARLQAGRRDLGAFSLRTGRRLPDT